MSVLLDAVDDDEEEEDGDNGSGDDSDSDDAMDIDDDHLDKAWARERNRAAFS